MTRPDNSTVLTDYNKQATRVQDEGNGSHRITQVFQADGLGRILTVCEVTSTSLLVSYNSADKTPVSCGQDISATGFLTSYSYDWLNNVISVTQGSMSRSFVYDQLSRLTSETNPESGIITYAYDTGSKGDLYQRVAPKANQSGSATATTTYTFDSLHRLLSKSYNDGTPTANLHYDESSAFGFSSLTNTKGRLSSVSTVSGSTTLAGSVFGYDTMGRTLNYWQCVGSTECSSSSSFHVNPYTYDLLGNVLTSPQGANTYLYTYTYDNASRLVSMTRNGSAPNTFFSSPVYNGLGELTSVSLGDVASNTGISETHTYDNRGRPVTQGTGVNGGQGIYNYSGVSYAPDGELLAIADSINGGTWTYTYDDFGRQASTSQVVNSTTNSYTYDYDRFGNRWHQNLTAGTGLNTLYNFNGKSQISGAPANCTSANQFCYDAAGNLLNDSYHTYGYDAEGKVTSVDSGSTTYVYEALGHRVQRTTSGTTVHFVYDLAGRDLAQYYSNDSWSRGESYVGGRHLATLTNSLVYFVFQDFVGTARTKMTYNGSTFESCSMLPFGDNKSCWGAPLTSGPDWFSDQERDTESNLDHFWFRSYSSNQGRWMASDPAGLAAVDMTNPQTWNRYAYVGNNPTSAVDPLGLFRSDNVGFDDSCSMNGMVANCAVVSSFASAGGGGEFGYWCSGCPTSGINTDAKGNPYPFTTKATSSGVGYDYMDLSSIAANELGLPSGASGGGFQAGGFFSPGGVKDAFGACAGLTPLNLDYSTIQHYFEGNMSAEQHIISGHISPGQPGNSMYAFYPPQAPAQAFYQVQGYNAATFLNPDNRSVGSNGNLIFDREFPVLPNPFADGADSYIGVSPQGTPLTNNRLILKPDCKTVRTSYPTP